jgi:hypothetical protein
VRPWITRNHHSIKKKYYSKTQRTENGM